MSETDFIIVGAGSAGCAMAERLSRNGRHTVTVLEAGGSDFRFFVKMPLGYGKTFYDPAVNWMYTTEPDEGLAGNSDYWPRGKLLGGSSSINAMVWIRGAPRDYEDWKAAGNPGWGWDEMLRAFREIEDYEGGADPWRGAGGPLHVSRIDKSVHPLTRTYLEACREAGLASNDDFNGERQEGAGLYQLTTRNGRRFSAADAFLKPAMKRSNVRVITHAQVTRILFDGRRAIGVEFERNGKRERLTCNREVILSGGSVNTPQLLQLSGIGDGALLARLGIAVVLANSNVGRHLADHQGINYTWKANRPTLNQLLRPWWGKLWAGMHYLMLRDGPLSISLNQGGGFFRTDPSLDEVNMQLYFQAFSTVLPRPGERPILTPDPWPGFSIGLSNCRTLSRGFIEAVSPDFRTKPKIVANAFSHERDVSEMLAAVKYLRHIAAQPAFREVIVEELLPGPSIASDEDMILDFRKRSGTVFHPCSTCRMGADAAQNVVDGRLRVHGIDRLRIADASIFPNITTGNTNAASIATGWRGAEFILEDNQ
ncbi:MAG: GMC family oxidoreductase N-terminal domain-containing protein [Nitratireductor sp.]|nr:GMC family oxidoreductase N-terminal domain-containing protein [Nitratireductor sp.]